MAYTQRYSIPWSSKTNSGYVYIDQLDNIVTSEPLQLALDGITINTMMNDWNDPILTQTAQIDILNTKPNFFDLMPLLTSEEREFKIRIVQTSPTSKQLFDGFLNTDIVEQTYLSKQPIRLVASNYVKKLENVQIDLNNIIQRSFIDYMIDSLYLIGTDSSIRVNMDIYPRLETLGTTKTAMNITGVNTEIFWKNSVERDNCLEIIKKILTPFDSYLYWYDGNWYIERYADMYDYPKHYVSYSLNSSYGYSNVGTSVTSNDLSTNIFANKHLSRSQLLSVIPGLNTIEVKLNDVAYDNLIVSDYRDASGTLWSATDYTYDIQMNKITYYKNDSIWQGYDIAIPYSVISNALTREGSPFNLPNIASINTRFRITIDDTAEQQMLNATWKYIPIPQLGTDIRLVDYEMRWFLKLKDTGGELEDKFIVYDGAHWVVKETIQPVEYTQFTYIKGVDIADVTGLTEVKATININDPSLNLSGDQEFVFGIMRENVGSSQVNPVVYNTYLEKAAYGDIVINVSGLSSQDNVIQATVSNKFLNKKNIELDIYDTRNLNYKNGIFSGSGLETRTSLWKDDNATELSLINKLITSKYQLYNKSRQSISSTIDSSLFLKPFSMWYDSNQPTKMFTLTGYTYRPTMNQYDCVWDEYDNTETINLNNV